MIEGSGHPPPPPPPQPPVVIDVRTVQTGDAVATVLPARPVQTDPRGNPDPVAEGQPPAGDGVIGRCDRCGRADVPLASWRVELAAPPAVILRGLCTACAAL